MKTLLDSVHGTIEIPKTLFKEIIDTVYFQRLRRIEQNSCRSVFPSARHDRFIHSIGVYHLGHLIVEHIKKTCGEQGKNILPANAKNVLETYELACLLHDVGHTPFSHTFEEFFDFDKAISFLKKELNDKNFNKDIICQKKAAEHEVISAYVAIVAFKDFLLKEKINKSLLARMITGYRYLDTKKEPNGCFENAMIELIHGDIIDADGLDYVCRDVWAGGYKNFNIDVTRLISSINIQKSPDGVFSVCYKSKALNEIETVLNVKNFQYLYVIKHHKVLLEQYYLVEAMKSTACFHLKMRSDTQNDRDDALRALCNINIFLKNKILKRSKYKLYRPVDDDFVSLMKLNEDSNHFIDGWFSRSFSHTPLWKSKLEYFNIFNQILSMLSEGHKNDLYEILKSPACKSYIYEKMGLSEDDIIVVTVKPKIRRLDANKINVLLNGKIIPYSELNHDIFALIGNLQSFCYYYIDFARLESDNHDAYIKQAIGLLKDFVADGLRDKWE